MLPPGWASRYPFLKILNLGNNIFTGALPPSWGAAGSFPALTRLDVSVNALSGSLPPSMYKMAGLQWLDLSLNFICECVLLECSASRGWLQAAPLLTDPSPERVCSRLPARNVGFSQCFPSTNLPSPRHKLNYWSHPTQLGHTFCVSQSRQQIRPADAGWEADATCPHVFCLCEDSSWSCPPAAPDPDTGTQ